MSDLFQKGDIVCAKSNRSKPLAVRIFARRIYYCDVVDHPKKKRRSLFRKGNRIIQAE